MSNWKRLVVRGFQHEDRATNGDRTLAAKLWNNGSVSLELSDGIPGNELSANLSVDDAREWWIEQEIKLLTAGFVAVSTGEKLSDGTRRRI